MHFHKADVSSQVPWIIPTLADTHWFGNGAILQFLSGWETSGMELFWTLTLVEPLGCLQWPPPTTLFQVQKQSTKAAFTAALGWLLFIFFFFF